MSGMQIFDRLFLLHTTNIWRGSMTPNLARNFLTAPVIIRTRMVLSSIPTPLTCPRRLLIYNHKDVLKFSRRFYTSKMYMFLGRVPLLTHSLTQAFFLWPIPNLSSSWAKFSFLPLDLILLSCFIFPAPLIKSRPSFLKEVITKVRFACISILEQTRISQKTQVPGLH